MQSLHPCSKCGRLHRIVDDSPAFDSQGKMLYLRGEKLVPENGPAIVMWLFETEQAAMVHNTKLGKVVGESHTHSKLLLFATNSQMAGYFNPANNTWVSKDIAVLVFKDVV